VGNYEEQWPLETQRRGREKNKIEGISKSGMGIWTGLIWLRIRTYIYIYIYIYIYY
jgi:hypothetical protein